MSFHTPAHKAVPATGACIVPEPAIECDFRYVDHGTIILLTPVTARAKAWAEGYEPFEGASTWGKAYAISHRDFSTVVDAIDNDGLYFAPEGH